MHNYQCDICGCNLDPGEICDCKRPAAPEPENRLVTYADWEAAGDFDKCARPGDYVEEDIVEEFLNCVPPASHKPGYIQCGEPYSHAHDPVTDRFRPTFATFHKPGDHWIYCGHCFIGQTKQAPENIPIVKGE
ncbi:MAG: hypothetical protein BWY85_00218 [Firmicutes bacterium ADurb.Bin506]|nr:MAG: hypothetical protein BWY85_00218 [Firmicutes bacterium ADurb.Bin506]